jgi:hypothetical protein
MIAAPTRFRSMKLSEWPSKEAHRNVPDLRSASFRWEIALLSRRIPFLEASPTGGMQMRSGKDRRGHRYSSPGRTQIRRDLF